MKRKEILTRFSGAGGDGRPLYLPDLSLWYAWHRRQNTLPAEWGDHSLPEIARAMGVPIWLATRPWRVEHGPAVQVEIEESDDARAVHYRTPAGPLVARWTRGPDGDWWQTKHLVEDAADLPAAQHLADSLTYLLAPEKLPELAASVGEEGVLALELPRRPYSDLLHDYVGWGQGLLLLMGGEKEALLEIHELLESKLQALVAEIVKLPGDLLLSPDNLDGQYVSPRVFWNQWADSYATTADLARPRGLPLVVHAGGPSRRLLPLLASAGVDAVQGVAGPPQADATLAQARTEAGPTLTLWGGIPQDFLIPPRSRESFEDAVAQAAREAAADPRALLGVADRVPTTAELDRLLVIPELIEKALR